MFLVRPFFIIIPTTNPGITHSIGSQTGPSKTPNNRKLEE